MIARRPSWGSPSAAAAGDEVGMLAAQAAEPFASVDDVSLRALLERIGDAEVVLIGEASHGTREFYRLRARITQALVERGGFGIVALEADWPDAAQLDRHARDRRTLPERAAFQRFPSWMWRNPETRDFVRWLREHNRSLAQDARVGVYGLDLYSLYASIESVLDFLGQRDPDAAELARRRYACLEPFSDEPTDYGFAAASGYIDSCEAEVTSMLRDLLQARMRDGHDDFFDALQNARLVASAERYYRSMVRGARESWNLRDSHMFDTLKALRTHRGGAKAIVWAHNSHVGDASATEMGAAGEHNLGSLSRGEWGDDVYVIGFGTDHGTVSAASAWDRPRETMRVRPARDDSFEGAFHASGAAGFLLGMRDAGDDVREALTEPRLERAIGVIYRPDTERASHYFHADLCAQFDEYVWIDETSAIDELPGPKQPGVPDTYPFGV